MDIVCVRRKHPHERRVKPLPHDIHYYGKRVGSDQDDIPADLLVEAHSLNTFETGRTCAANTADPLDADHIADLHIRCFGTCSELDDFADTCWRMSVVACGDMDQSSSCGDVPSKAGMGGVAADGTFIEQAY